MLETIERYGLDAFQRRDGLLVRHLGRDDAPVDHRKLPDGVYEAEDQLDADGIADDEPYVLHVKVTKRGHHVEVDLSGSSRQARTSINAGWLDTKTGIGVAFKFLFDPISPFTSAAYRDIDIVLPGRRSPTPIRPTGRSSCTGRAR